MIQHVTNHAGAYHRIETSEKKELTVNSIHHQMCVPKGTNHELLAWAAPKLSDVYFDEDKEVNIDIEPELIYYPDLKGLAIQWHPEMMRLNHPTQDYVYAVLKEKGFL